MSESEYWLITYLYKDRHGRTKICTRNYYGSILGFIKGDGPDSAVIVWTHKLELEQEYYDFNRYSDIYLSDVINERE
jgi:hypothetical protein